MSLSEADRRYSLFAFLFAFATLCFHAQLRLPIGVDLRTASFVAAMVTMVRPAALVPFSALAIFLTLAIYGELPNTNTNRLLQFFVGLIVIATLLTIGTRRPRARLTTDVLLHAMELPLKLTLLVLYFWAFVHKLNWGYLAPGESCAMALLEQLPIEVAVPPAGRIVLIAGTLVIEGLMVPLLVVPRWRSWGVRIGLAFHFVLGFAGFYSFSATMIALLALFIPSSEVEQAIAGVRNFVRRQPRVLPAGAAAVFLAGAAMLLYADPGLERTRLTTSLWSPNSSWLENISAIWKYAADRLFLGLWAAFALPIGAMWLRAMSELWQPSRQVRIEPSWRWQTAAWLALLVPAIAFLNGASTYLGWKTEMAFAMYSNLRTERGFENHLFLPSLSLMPYQSDLVVIKSSSDKTLEEIAAGARPMPLVELRQLVATLAARGARNLRITYASYPSGTTRQVDAAESDLLLAEPLSYLEQKLLRFRVIQAEGCSH